MRNSYIIIACTITMISGCATQPKMVSKFSEKNISHPKPNKINTIKPGVPLYIKYNYESVFAYKLNQPLNISAALGNVVIDKNDHLFENNKNGRDMLCTSKRTYIDPLTGPHAISCLFHDTKTKTVNKVSYAPGMIWFEKDISPPIGYSYVEIPKAKSGPLKKEIIYIDTQDKRIEILYKEYNKDLNTADINKPIFIKISDTPFKAKISDVNIRIISIKSKSLKYKIL